MDKPTIVDDNLRRRALWNQSDLDVYKGPTPVDSTTTEKKRILRDEIANDVEAFLAAGGTITVLEDEATGYEKGRQAFVINVKNNSNAT